MSELEKIKVLIWDFDGTLYKPDKALWQAVRRGEYQTIQAHTGWDLSRTELEFNKLYPKVIASATEVVALVSGIPTAQAVVEMENYFDRRKYISKDPQIPNLFKSLAGFTHYMLANGSKKHISETMEYFGIPLSTFSEIVTSEIVGVNKPNPAGFQYIMKMSGLNPEAHLMVGDREIVDLAPAKKIGMQTCLVWAETKSKIADFTLPSVYLVPLLFKVAKTPDEIERL
jgi:HAD superfamily hydrolase (TIGR01549 family)